MKFKLGFAALFAAMMFAGSAMAAEELKFQSMYPPTQAQNTEYLVPWCESFAVESKGQLDVHFFPIGAVVNPAETRNSIKNGMLDMGLWGSSAFPKDTPYVYNFSMPFLAKNTRHATAIAYALYDQLPEFKKDIDSAGKMLGIWSSATIGLSSINQAIRTPADLKGKRVLICGPADVQMVESWGGIPVLVTPGDVYVGLQRGMGEVFFGGLPFQRGLRIMEVAKYVTPVPCAVIVQTLSINNDVFNDLDKSLQDLIIAKTGRAFSDKLAASLDADVDRTLAEFAAAGAEVVKLTDEEFNAFAEGAKSILESQWIPAVEGYGIKNAADVVKKYYEVAASIAVPE